MGEDGRESREEQVLDGGEGRMVFGSMTVVVDPDIFRRRWGM